MGHLLLKELMKECRIQTTPVDVAPSINWSMAEEGSQRVGVAGLNDKRQVTSTLAVSLDGQFLPFQVLYQEKTDRCHPSYTFPDDLDIFHTHNHWANGETVTVTSRTLFFHMSRKFAVSYHLLTSMSL